MVELLKHHDFDVIFDTATTFDLPVASAAQPPDVILMGLEGESTPAHLANIHAAYPTARTILIDDADSRPEIVHKCLTAGAHGIITNEAPAEALMQYINLIKSGLIAVAARGVDPLPPPRSGIELPPETVEKPPCSRGLSRREKHVLTLIANGAPNKVIARELDISESTVKAHLKSILKKIGVLNRTQAAVWAYSKGLVSENPA
ncbi:MAG: response regulator transcription factor [Pseudomonadota bacterium]